MTKHMMVKIYLAIASICLAIAVVPAPAMSETFLAKTQTCETMPASNVCVDSVVSAFNENQKYSSNHDSDRQKKHGRRNRLPPGVKLYSDLEYANVDGQSLRLDLYVPENSAQNTKTKSPLIIWIHGGGWVNGDKGKINSAVTGLSADGYAVASLNYRLQGLDSHPAQIHDVKGAVRWLRAKAGNYGYDATRIAVGGGSAGGHLALLLGLSANDKYLEGEVAGNLDQSSSVQAIIDMFGPSSLQDYADVSKRFRNNKSSDPVVLKSASPLTYLSSDDPPLLIFHGDQDKVVPISQSVNLHKDYQQAGLDSTLHIIKGAGHGGKEFTTSSQQHIMKEFLDLHIKKLKPRQADNTEVINLPAVPAVSYGTTSPRSKNAQGLSEEINTSNNFLQKNKSALYGFHWIIGPRSGLAGSEKKFNRLLHEIEQTLSNNSLISGVYIITHWNLIEAKEGQFEFERLDRIINLVRSHGRYYKLAVAPGIYSPDWLYLKGAKSFETVGSNPQRKDIYNTSVKIPLPWDPIYQAAYFSVMEQVANRYSRDKNFRAVTATVATFMSPEWHLPHSKADRKKWQSYNNFEDKLEQVWKDGIDRFARLFPAQYITVEASSYPVGEKALGDSVIDYGVKNHSGRFTVQINQLMGKFDQIDRPTYVKLLDYRDKYGSSVIIGLQNLKGWSFPGISKKQGSKEMTAYNYLQADGEYWELWFGDGKNLETVTKLQALIDQGQSLGMSKFKKKLKGEGKYRPPGK